MVLEVKKSVVNSEAEFKQDVVSNSKIDAISMNSSIAEKCSNSDFTESFYSGFGSVKSDQNEFENKTNNIKVLFLILN